MSREKLDVRGVYVIKNHNDGSERKDEQACLEVSKFCNDKVFPLWS